MKKQILFIDDDTEELEIFLEAINKIPGKFKCTYASSPLQAIEILKYLTPDYIFVDFNLPKMNGLQFLTIIQQQGIHNRVLTYLYSNGLNEELNRMALLSGATGCIEKTNTIGSLVTELQTVFSKEIIA
jgi:CheY-like chemotaxis protein